MHSAELGSRCLATKGKRVSSCKITINGYLLLRVKSVNHMEVMEGTPIKPRWSYVVEKLKWEHINYICLLHAPSQFVHSEPLFNLKINQLQVATWDCGQASAWCFWQSCATGFFVWPHLSLTNKAKMSFISESIFYINAWTRAFQLNAAGFKSFRILSGALALWGI